MQIESAIQTIAMLENPSGSVRVPFVVPALSATLAAHSIRSDLSGRVTFAPDAASYAANNGLLEVLEGRYSFPVRSGLQGQTYTKLTRLHTHSEVENCNAIVNDLIAAQLDDFSPALAQKIRRVVGELHDNVASHANGYGFSCVQVYRHGDARRIEFAIADAGCGMLANVRRVRSEIQTDGEAIEWCLSRGNTTAQNRRTGWEQKVPDDIVVSPFPDSMGSFAVDDHHVGEGLWRLAELTAFANGSMAVLSGNALLQRRESETRVSGAPCSWPGVVVEVELTARTGEKLPNQQEEALELLAERLGI